MSFDDVVTRLSDGLYLQINYFQKTFLTEVLRVSEVLAYHHSLTIDRI